jgi:hypothetical protein
MELIIIPLNLERMPAISDQTSLPFFACYELMLSEYLCFRMNFGSQSEGKTSKFGSPTSHGFQLIFVTLVSSLELFWNLKLVLLPCYSWLWVRFPNPL